MPRYGTKDTVVVYNGQTISQWVTEIGDVATEALLEEITSMGDAWERHAFIGVMRSGQITLAGPYADDANSLSDVADDVGVGGTATLTITFGGSKTYSVSTIQVSHTKNISRGQLTKSTVVLQGTGQVTEA